MAERRPLIAGTWKMNGLRASIAELEAVIAGAGPLAAKCDLLICPPATLIGVFAGKARGSKVSIGAQDCHHEPSGAHTGDLSAEMLRDAGASAVIVGHSERRIGHAEQDLQVRIKAQAVRRAGLLAIICVGETREQREAAKAVEVVSRQIDGSVPDGATPANTAIAYEPVWAIGTGLTPKPADMTEMHRLIRERLVRRFGSGAAATRVLYGGSVKPDNAAALLLAPECDGALVGGASLKATDFLAIAGVYGR